MTTIDMPEVKSKLAKADSEAQSGNFQNMLTTCSEILEEAQGIFEVHLEVGSLLLKYGFLTLAKKQFEKATELEPNNSRAILSIANVAQNFAQHKQAHNLYSALLVAAPNDAVVRRNILISQQYNPDISDKELLEAATSWGEWANSRVVGEKIQRHTRSLIDVQTQKARPLKVGYVSGDFCQHTVGLFIKHVFEQHAQPFRDIGNSLPIEVFAYSNTKVNDWVTKDIQACCTFRDVLRLDDRVLARLIEQDQIDVLVDLSGHTADSRLAVFAYKPAPVQISWLGYFATTGLREIDAVILDKWHAPPGTETQFTEQIIRLEAGRFCYQAVPWAPQISSPPSIQNGYITFGSFNNTSKLNASVFNVWADVLNAVPNSRLVLKWRTLVDETLQKNIQNEFLDRGVDTGRIELRSASFHAELLNQYADIDIALDPFPFTGGLTSCEALWMGVPVVTLPQNRVVSRQTHAILCAMGLNDWSAHDESDYIQIAKSLASDAKQLETLRKSLRGLMQASTLTQAREFTNQLEFVYYDLYSKVLIN